MSLAILALPLTVVLGFAQTKQQNARGPLSATAAVTYTRVYSLTNPSTVGHSVTLLALVAPGPGIPGTPTGLVEFFDGLTSIGSSNLTDRVAALNFAFESPGQHFIVAKYGGDGAFSRSTSVVLNQAVQSAANQAPVVSAGPNQAITQSWELLVSSNNTLAVADEAVLRFDGTSGSFLGVVTPIQLSDGISSPRMIFVDSKGRLYVGVRGGSDQHLGGIYRYVLKTGAFIDAFVPIGKGGPGDAPAFAFDASGTLFITVELEQNIKRFNPKTSAFEVFATDPLANAAFTALDFRPDGNLYATNGLGRAVLKFDGTTGKFLSKFADGAPQGIFDAADLLFGPDGNLYVTGLDSGDVLRFNGKTGAFIDTFVAAHAGGLARAGDLKFGPDGNLYVADTPASSNAGQVLRYDGKTGSFIDVFVPAGSGGLLRAAGILFHPILNPAVLLGTVRDDGLPAGSTLTVTWSKVSGPGTVTFGNAHAARTTADFSAPGTYVLRLTASDGQLSSSADTTVTVSLASRTTPQISSVTPASGQQGQTLSVSITGQNTHFAQATTRVSFGAGVTVGSVVVRDDTHLTAQLSIDPAAIAGPRTVTVTTGAESTSLVSGFTVSSGPSITSISPNEGRQGLGGPIAIVGSNTHFVQGRTQIDLGPGITVSNVTVNCSTCLMATLAIDAAAPLGMRTLTVTTGSEIVTLGNSFTVGPPGNALLTVNPRSAFQSKTLSVTITAPGMHFVQGTTMARFGPGIMVGSGIVGDFGPVTVTSPTTATAQISILSTAFATSRTVVVQTGTEQVSATNAFTVLGLPFLTSIAPSSALHGQTRTVVITGVFTSFLQGTTQASFGPGISVGGAPEGSLGPVTVTSPVSATAQLSINPAAKPGPRTVTAQTDTQQAALVNAFSVLGPVTGPPPVVAITSPVEGTEITTATAVTGTVTSPIIDYWTLEYQASGAVGFRQFATGTSATVSGTLDPTLLLNGLTVVRLTAIDTSGQAAATTITVVVTRNQKVGNFTVSFNDLTVPMAGLPIQIVRTYDSRNQQMGDFGVAWTLDLKNVFINTNGALGAKWTGTRSGGLVPQYCVQAAQKHVVSVSLPDGTTYEFEPILSGQCQAAPPSQVTIGFTPSGATPPNATLAVAGSNLLNVSGAFPGPVMLLDSDLTAVFDPDQYILTLPDGRKLQISHQSGLQVMTDLNGNTLTVQSDGIFHSSGNSITFTRDDHGRIKEIQDPVGNTLFYTYDANGDLVSFTNQVNKISSYTYNNTHGLLTIKDPSGAQPIRNDYDETGRLVSHTDAYGNVVNYTHNLDTRQEIITDRLGHVTVNEYDLDGNIVTVTDALGGITSRTYDPRDNMLSEKNALGETRTYTYDANNNRKTDTSPLGHTTTYTYNGRNQVVTITDPLNHVTSNAYDDATGNLASTKDAAGNVTSRIYNPQGLLANMTDPLGGVTSYQYDSFGNLRQQTDAIGNIVTYVYDANGNKLSETKTRTTDSGKASMVTSYQYDHQNRLIQTDYPDGSNTQIKYNDIGKESSTIDQLGHQTSYQYDLMGRLTQTSYADGTSETSTYDAESERVASTDRATRRTTYVYDQLKRLTKTVYPDNASTSTGYDAAGEVTSATDVLGNTTQFHYDADGRRDITTDALGHATTDAYDGVGNQSSMTDANGHTTRYQYDPLNRRTTILYPDSTSDVTSYDALGRTIRKTDQANKTTQFEYDLIGRLTKVTDALGQVTTYTYDEVGARITQTDANKHTTTFAYDDLGRRTKRTLPLGMSETQTYDSVGNLKTKTDFNGRTTTYTYDEVNRLLSKTPDSTFSQTPVSFTYTSTGQRESMTDPSGRTDYTYDLRDRLVRKATPEGTLSYLYDDAGNLKSMKSSNADGTSVTYSYDKLNRLSEAVDNRPGSGVTTYSYDDVGNLARYSYPNGVTTGYQYNSLNRLNSLTITKGAPLASYSYTLGPAGNRTAVSELSGRQTSYTYDDLYRLKDETISGSSNISANGTIGYTYDAVGNRLTRSSTVAAVPPATHTYDENDRLKSDTYDANGSTLGSGGHAYTYDFENHLIAQSGSTTVTIVYDGDGNRVSKTAGGTTTQYLVDNRNLTDYPQVVEEISGGAVQRVYTYGLNRISQSQASGTSFYGYDGHGNVRLLIDATGAVTDRYDYDAFGVQLQSTGVVPNDFRYAGEQHDSNLGLYYLRARYLDPTSGRFKSADTFEGNPYDPGTLHGYLYVHGNPVNLSDPSGLLTLQEQILTVSIISTLESVAVIHIATNRLEQQGGKFAGVFASLRTGVELTGTGFQAGFDIAYDFDSRRSCAIPTIEVGISATRGRELGVSAGLGLYTGETACDAHDPALGSTVNIPLNFYKLGSVITAPLAQKLPFSGLLTRLANTANASPFSVSIGIAPKAASFALTYNGGLGITATLAGQPYPLDSDLAALRSLSGTALDSALRTLRTVAAWGPNFSDIEAHAGDFTSLVPQF